MPPSEDEPRWWRDVRRWVWGWVWTILIGCLAAAGIMHWLYSFAIVPSASMRPTIPDPCYIMVNHLATDFIQPYRGEVVLFHFPDDTKEIYVKRIIGLPGDTVTIHDEHVFVNQHELNEPYLHGLQTEGVFGPYVVPAGDYFMLGDNRSVSEDSRYWVHKYVPKSYIVGRADRVVWPLSKWKGIE